MPTVKVVEVGMRDGLQNEKVHLNQKELIKFARYLEDSGVRHIEAGAFVSPKWVPQMSGSKDLLKKLCSDQKSGNFNRRMHLMALTPNLRGFQDAMDVGVKEVAVFGAASKSFSLKNINCTPAESIQKFKLVTDEAKKKRVRVRAYVSTAFACPYEGKVSVKKVNKMVEAFLALGVYEISIGDTIGAASPKQVKKLLSSLEQIIEVKKIAMHFHDTRGTGLANTLMSLENGVRTFDTSIGGLGGCPYADGAAGNLATEDLVYMLDSMGMKTGIDIESLVKTTHWLNRLLNKALPSKLSRAGTRRFF